MRSFDGDKILPVCKIMLVPPSSSLSHKSQKPASRTMLASLDLSQILHTDAPRRIYTFTPYISLSNVGVITFSIFVIHIRPDGTKGRVNSSILSTMPFPLNSPTRRKYGYIPLSHSKKQLLIAVASSPVVPR